MFQMRKESDAGDFRNSRPISDYSGSEYEQSVNVKKREAKPMRHIQVKHFLFLTSSALKRDFILSPKSFFLHPVINFIYFFKFQQRPLTRYLPIKSESLNLRQHIESAGHQVDLCPHISIDATSCRGVLHKLGGKFHHWNKRWFVFDRTRRTLMYFADKSEKKQRGGTYFQVSLIYIYMYI